jgi:hypothetical protein
MNSVEHLRRHLTKDYLERLSNMALAAAGFSAGLLVLLVESSAQPPHSEIALWSAIFSLILSLGAWQYFLPYILYGESTYDHISLGLVAFFQIFIVGTLFVSVTALVLALSYCAGILLVILGVGLTIFVLHHNFKVAQYSMEKEA